MKNNKEKKIFFIRVVKAKGSNKLFFLPSGFTERVVGVTGFKEVLIFFLLSIQKRKNILSGIIFSAKINKNFPFSIIVQHFSLSLSIYLYLSLPPLIVSLSLDGRFAVKTFD